MVSLVCVQCLPSVSSVEGCSVGGCGEQTAPLCGVDLHCICRCKIHNHLVLILIIYDKSKN